MGVNPPAGYKTDVIIAAFRGEPISVKKLWNKGIDAMVSSWHRAAPNTIQRQLKLVVTIYPHY